MAETESTNGKYSIVCNDPITIILNPSPNFPMRRDGQTVILKFGEAQSMLGLEGVIKNNAGRISLGWQEVPSENGDFDYLIGKVRIYQDDLKHKVFDALKTKGWVPYEEIQDILQQTNEHLTPT